MGGKVALVTGVGPGTGASIVRRLAKGGYEVAMLSRTEERLLQLEKEIPGTHAFVTDVTDEAQLDATLGRIRGRWGHPYLVVHNAVSFVFGTFMEIDPAAVNRNFQTNVMALLHLARRTAPAMVEAGGGSIVVTGNTSSLRGKSTYAGFAPTKAAQRILAESIARDLWPKGVHVAHVVIDAVIDLEWTRKLHPTAPDDFFIQPDDIAEEVWHVAHQPRGSWSFNVEIRPAGEHW
ncbi:SDR family NAD(P)-dependent oxidoreductase [Pendulispora rubella]|uniref:SDR family NAD(P)-dependent oxidoreductase n=1 Tax=Pendulispora rubella TaxID=2741070 RepID=A0ABZ2KP58_9BACT